MTPNQLYNTSPDHVTNDLYLLRVHLPEIAKDLGSLTDYNTEITIKVLEDHDFDVRRFWRLATVWMAETPVMIIQNAGREGRDHTRRFITNIPVFKQMCDYINNLPYYDECYEDGIVDDFIDEEMNSEELTNFYGGTFIP